ncbi:MAG: GPR endopeptidase [Dethiobacter sp.]|jgi:spore protease|nr:GPR endopeptidase [Dethiobacter sp.]
MPNTEHREGFIPNYNIRTDLALEAHEIIQNRGGAAQIPGIFAETHRIDGITISRIKVENEAAALQLGKALGNYITLDAPGMRVPNTDLQEKLSEVLAEELRRFLPLPSNLEETVLVVGLGNWNVTPDSLGPKVIEDLLVTRHAFETQSSSLGEGFRSVCAISPGVLGITGIETGEIIQALVQRVKPALVIAIDALAASRLERLHTTIQIADTGISPGSGVGNNRLGVTKETTGVPVTAIGVPTVVDASTIAGAAMEAMIKSFKREAAGMEALGLNLERMDWEEKQMLISEVLNPYAGGRLMVTPKEIDTFIDEISLTIAAGINAALHPKVHSADPGKFLQ